MLNVTMEKNLYLLTIDGKTRTIKEAAEYFGVSKDYLVKKCQKNDTVQFEADLADYRWKKLHGYSSMHKVHKFDGHRLTISTVIDRTGLCPSNAQKKLARVLVHLQKGKITERQAYAELTTRTARVENTARADRLSSIPGPGTWESKHLNPKSVPIGRSGPVYGVGY